MRHSRLRILATTAQRVYSGLPEGAASRFLSTNEMRRVLSALAYRTRSKAPWQRLGRRRNKGVIENCHVRVTQSHPMSCVFDQQPPELLQILYKRLFRRYGAPSVRRANFPGRWMAFRTPSPSRARATA
jgi:hypothetical protein